jgi:iodotyrosine deiodinase
MKFLAELFDRPKNERAYVVIPVGYPHPEARVPDLRRKRLEEFVTWDPKPKA